jgi:sugar lactone lactonase YvrE
MRLLTTLFVLAAIAVNAQSQLDTTDFPPLKIGDWRQHLPWQRTVHVSQSASKIYFATEWAVVELDKTDRTANFITKVEGLSDVGINLIRYNQAAKALIISYTNSNLDLYYPADGSVLNLPFIQKNPNIIGDKKVYDVFFSGTSAYFACGFGILKFDMEAAEAEYTVFTNIAVKSVSQYGGYLWASTDDGLFRLPENDENPADFGRWKMVGTTEGFPVGDAYGPLRNWNNALYLGYDNKLLRLEGGTVTEIASLQNRAVKFLTAEGTGLVIAWTNESNFGIGSVEYLEPSGTRSEIHGPCGAEFPLYAIESDTKKFWFSDQNDAFRYYDHALGQCDKFAFNSPFRHISTEISIANNKVYLATPGAQSNLAPLYEFRSGVYVFEDNAWTRFTGETNPEIKPFDCDKDMWRVAAHPEEDNKVYIGSFVGGLIEATTVGATTQCYTKDNSILEDAGESGDNRTAIGGMAFDADNNLWISNFSSSAPIAVKKADNTWKNFPAAPANKVLQVAVDQAGYKWFVLTFNAGLMVFDSGSDIDDTSDDRYKIITTANSVLPTNTINCVTVDLDGDVWVGTQQGVVSFECGSNVFSTENPCLGRRRIVNVDGFNGYLLETEDVRTIAVDGANRKWFGTTNGIFVQSPDGLTQVARYTNTNSPLFDNAITDIAINTKNGEIWIGTEKGVLSVRGEATVGGKVNKKTAYAYPNPVQPDYDGPIAINGLARDANVKITDVAGNLVFEGKSLGGQAVWDGRDYLGRRVASGVYLIYATSQATFDEPDAIITKVIILN